MSKLKRKNDMIKTKSLLVVTSLLSFSANSMDSYINLTAGLIEGSRPPYFFVENGKLKGAYIDILNAISEKSGFYIDYKFLPQAKPLQQKQPQKGERL